ncbi:DUF1194 domain-containing protein [Roseitranquillus sediminis]|uniref:DUF1194 domain-containing protein n=1 Tax=Roseitranquillus sediminis TaxID=2809051 RepID=UPI001D0BF87A|nr:DUF1194 domain-containing protein [Roseitranquillus sediminis]MBM9595754.1 DUF1194 domain-containing protein [Roseitranquillus sediminis]
MRNLILALTLLLAPLPLAAQDVELELVLLADASGSIDPDEIRFQRMGYATALTDPEVLAAISNTAYGSIAVTYVEWGSAASQDVVVPWTVIDGAESATAFAAALLPPPQRAFGRNGIGAALLKGKELIENNDLEGWRKVIDFSGDSANNWTGPPIETSRDEVLAAGITINALAVLCRTCSGQPSGPDLELLYEQRVIGGRGAFVVTAAGPDTFAESVKRKLILEISGTLPASRTAEAR